MIYVCTGGLGFTLHQIGTALSVVGIIMVPLMLLAFTSVSIHGYYVTYPVIVSPHRLREDLELKW